MITIYPIIIKSVIKNDALINQRRISSFKMIIFIMSSTSRQIIVFMNITFSIIVKELILRQIITFIKAISFNDQIESFVTKTPFNETSRDRVVVINEY